jgi:CRP-like cAMP-binding protein
MDSSDVAPLLARSELCAALSEDERRTIARLGTVDVAEQGAHLMTEGEPGSSMLMLLDGEVSVQKGLGGGRSREIARLGPGAILGELGLLEPAPRTATVRALEPVRYFRVSRERFSEELASSTPAATKLVVALARVLAQRQRALNRKVVELADRLERQEKGDAKLVDDLIIEFET